MSGADDLMHSIARLNAAMDRISSAVPRILATHAEAQQTAAAHHATQAASTTPNADIAARLDSLIEQLRSALSSTSG
jgi:hypothetical protein